MIIIGLAGVALVNYLDQKDGGNAYQMLRSGGVAK